MAIRCRALTVQGILGVVLQLILSVGVPVFQHVVVYRSLSKYMWVMGVMIGGTGVPAVLCIAGLITQHPYVVAAHALLSAGVSALLGSFATSWYLHLANKCSVSQIIGRGCASCPCALTSTCTEAQLSQDPCSTCDAVGMDVCIGVQMQALMMPYTGLICAVVIMLPGIFTLLMLLQLPRLPGVAPSTDTVLPYGAAAYDQQVPTDNMLPEPQWPDHRGGTGDEVGYSAGDIEAPGAQDPYDGAAEVQSRPQKKKGLKKKKKKKGEDEGGYMDGPTGPYME